jgi:hypothetical protein
MEGANTTTQSFRISAFARSLAAGLFIIPCSSQHAWGTVRLSAQGDKTTANEFPMFSFELHWLAGGGSAKPSTPHAENVVGMIFDDEILAQSWPSQVGFLASCQDTKKIIPYLSN